ncbi:MAG: cation diffusion facilitator family transporter [Halobacteriota archaeon]
MSIVAIVVNILLMASKMAAGILIGSAGLVADGVDSLTNIFGAAAVLIGLHVSLRPADVEHPYGHSNAESIAELVVAFIIISSAILITYESASALFAQRVASDLLTGIVVASVSVIAAWFLSLYKNRVGMRIKSSALITESKHSITDAFSSIAVIFGLVLTGLGYWYMDPIVGILISLFIINVGIRVAKSSIDTLMNREAPFELIERLQKIVQGVPEVKQVNYVHIRGTWSYKIADVSITVRRRTTTEELSTIQGKIEAGVFEDIPEVHLINISVSTQADVLTIAVCSTGAGLEATIADDLGKCEYFVVARFEEDRIEIVGSFENLFKEVERKKGAQIADFMKVHEVDIVITGHAGEGVIHWLKGYGIDVMIITDSTYSIREAIKAAQLGTL